MNINQEIYKHKNMLWGKREFPLIQIWAYIRKPKVSDLEIVLILQDQGQQINLVA